LDYQLSPPLDENWIARRRSIQKCIQLADEILPELASALNNCHVTSHSLRYWKILLGHWLLRFVSTLYHRYHALERALIQYAPVSTTMLRPDYYQLATADSLSFIWATDDDLWNHVLWCEALADLRFPLSAIEYRNIETSPCFLDFRTGLPKRSPLRAIAGFVFDSILPRFARDKDALIIASYLPAKLEATLQLRLGQVPQRWTTPKISFPPPLNRTGALSEFDTTKGVGFERFLRRLLPRSLPSCFLEGYQCLSDTVDMLLWPKRPTFIFTSNNFDTDEVFKGWAAAKAEAGIPYFAGQHGNNYGTHMLLSSSSWPELGTTDAFLSWGWSGVTGKVVPAFNFKRCSGLAKWSLSPAGGLLLIEAPAWHACTPWDAAAEHHAYLAQQFRFVDALNSEILSKLIVRMHPDIHRMRYHEIARWNDLYSDVEIDDGKTPLPNLIRRSRLVVHSYDSTGILEMLAANQPFICFWPNRWGHLVDSAIPHYELLREVGIFQDSPEHAAAKIMAVWDDIPSWWYSLEVQQVRTSLCRQYSRQTPSPAAVLARLLKKLVQNKVH
jgi:putative transferase (TIGR04331 family)